MAVGCRRRAPEHHPGRRRGRRRFLRESPIRTSEPRTPEVGRIVIGAPRTGADGTPVKFHPASRRSGLRWPLIGGEAIELERIPDQLHAGRPDYGQPGSTVGLFRIAPDGQTAVRVAVELGRGSVNRIEVLAGLAEADEVILSDTSAWDTWDAIRLR